MLSKQQLGKNIKELRKWAGISQEELAKRVEISRPALSEIERGNRSLDALELTRFASCFNIKVDELLNFREVKPIKQTKKASVNKNIKFDSEKLCQLILYILEKCGGKPNFGETVLYKLLYFIDFDSFENLGKPVTCMNYVKLQFGPVPQIAQFKPVVEDMQQKGQIKMFSQNYHNKKQKRYVALIDTDLSKFSIQEKNVIDEVISLLSNLSATQIEAYSHGDVPWQIVSSNEVIPYNLVFDREPPYTKRNYWEEWQNAAGSDTLKKLGPMSEEEADYYKNL